MENLSRRSFIASSAAMVALASCARGSGIAHKADLAVGAVRRFVSARGLPGLVVVAGDGRSPHEFRTVGSLGRGSSGPMADDTLFRLYCMTKPITGLAVQTMIAQGRLGLDDPVSLHLPELAHMQVSGPKGGLTPAHRMLTIRDLLCHSGGITQPGLSINAAVPAYLKHGIIEPRLTVASTSALRGVPPASMDAFVAAMGQVPLLFEPGTSIAYGVSYDLLGAILERMSRKSLDAVLREMVLTPLGMHDTMFVVDKANTGRLSAEMGASDHGIVVNESLGTGVYTQTPSYFEGGNGLVSSPRDYARFMDAVMMPGRAPSALRAGLKQLPVDLLPPGLHYEDKGLICGMCTGGAVSRNTLPHRVGKGTYFWSGVGGTYYWADFEAGYWMLLMTQIVPASTLKMKDAITDAIYV